MTARLARTSAGVPLAMMRPKSSTDVVADVEHEAHVVVDEEHRDVAGEETAGWLPSTWDSVVSSPAAMLVEEDGLGSGRRGPGHADQLALAVGEVARGRSATFASPMMSSAQSTCSCSAASTRPGRKTSTMVEYTRTFRRHQEVVADRQVLEELERLERPRQAQMGPGVRRHLVDLGAVEVDRAARGPCEAGDGVDEGGLAGTVGPMSPVSLPGSTVMSMLSLAFRPP